MSRLLNMHEAAERLGVDASDVRDLRGAGRLRPAAPYPPGFRRFEEFEPAEVDRVLAEIYPSHVRVVGRGRERVEITVVRDDHLPRLP